MIIASLVQWLLLGSSHCNDEDEDHTRFVEGKTTPRVSACSSPQNELESGIAASSTSRQSVSSIPTHSSLTWAYKG